MSAAEQYDGPHRRLRLRLDVEADSISALAYYLDVLARDLTMRRGETLETTSAGYRGAGFTGGYRATLTCDPDMTADRYRDALALWVRNRKTAAS